MLYEVTFWTNGARNTVWVESCEIVTDDKLTMQKIGFANGASK